MHTWRKIGRIFLPSGQRNWMMSHAACPIPFQLSNDRYRIYFGTRDRINHPRIGFIEINLSNPMEVLAISTSPVLDIGAFGMFDENGVYPGGIVVKDSKIRMYYCGRCNLEKPRYAMAIGMAESIDGGYTFSRFQQSPIFDRSPSEPWSVSTPCIIESEGKYLMWYLAGTGWDDRGKLSYYDIRRAHSIDGVNWVRDGFPQIKLESGETNIASPAVIKRGGLWHMWFCTYHPSGYKLGYAYSCDGEIWIRDDQSAGINFSSSGWDSRGMAYPSVFAHDENVYILYSGNNYGGDGMGMAILTT